MSQCLGIKQGWQGAEGTARGPLASNHIAMTRNAALDVLGLVNLPQDYVSSYLTDGSLVRVLEGWCPSKPGYHLYYPSRRQRTAAFSLLVDALKHRS